MSINPVDAPDRAAEHDAPEPRDRVVPRSPGSRRGSATLGDRVQSLRLDDLPAEGRGRSALVGLLLLAALVGGGWYAWRYFTAGAKQESAEVAAPAKVLAQTAEKKVASGGVVLESKGYIVPAHQILVSPQVNGRILELFIEEGKQFERGAVLAELEKTEYEADLARAKANVALAEAKLNELENGSRPEEIKQAEAAKLEAEALVRQYKSLYQREVELRRTNTITPQQLEDTESRLAQAMQKQAQLAQALELAELGPRKERIQQARAELGLAKAELAKAEWRMSNCTIRSPITGTILKKNAEEGNIVNAMAFNGSFSVCEMADLSDLEVDLNIQERDISNVFKGQKCLVRADAWPNRMYYGYVDRLMPIADRAKGAVPVRVKVSVPPQEEGVYLKPEMGALVTFLNERVTLPMQPVPPTVNGPADNKTTATTDAASVAP